MEDKYIGITKVLNNNHTVTIDDAALKAAGAEPKDVLEIQFRVLHKAPRVVVDEPQH